MRKRTEALAGSCAEIWAENSIMAGNRCVLCGSTRATDPGASFHRFPADKTARARWIANLQLGADAVKPYSRLCSRHFPGGDPSKEPQLNLGKRFASPRKRDHPRARRARLRDVNTSQTFI